MKKRSLVFIFLISTLYGRAQTALAGIWEGKMNAGIEFRMIFHFSQDASNNFIVTLDCPDQGIKNVKASSFNLKGDSIYFEISQFQAKYSGKISNDTIITGKMEQGQSLALNLKKVKSVTERKRSQTPTAPFPYLVEDLVYYNKDKSISYGATITIPDGKGPFPAALLLTGSGQQNRDEEIAGHKPFAVIADHLTRNGFIVLRVDDRGMGKTTGDIATSTSRDFANDAIVSLEYLKTRKEVDKSKMGLIGHSEGGMIAQIIAAERTDIAFVIMLAGPGEKTLKLMSDQNEAILLKSGMSKEYVSAYGSLYNQVLATLLSSDDLLQKENVGSVVDKWIANTPDQVVVATTGIKDESSRNNFINQFVSQLNRPWIKYFLGYDPAINLKKVSAKVLALNGSRDIQVVAKTNLAAIEDALKNGKSKKFEVKELPGLNHLFQECKTCTTAEYAQIEETLSPTLLQTISDWMKRNL